MAQVVKLKRTSVQGKVPSTSNLDLGELAINTFDGRIFFEKDNGEPSIEHVVTTNSDTTGSLNIYGDVTASNLLITGDTIVSGNLTLGGTIYIGDNPSDSVIVSAEFSGSLIPDGNEYYDLGSAAKKWNNIYSKNVRATDISATSISGSFSGSFIGDGSGLTNLPNADVSQVATVTASFDNQSSIEIEHNFNSKNVFISVYDTTDSQIIPKSVVLTDNNTATIELSTNHSGYVVVGKGGHIVSGTILQEISEVVTVTASFDNTSTINVLHNFSSRNVVVSVYDSNYSQLIPELLTLTDENSVDIVLSGDNSGHVVVAKGGHLVNGTETVSYNNLSGIPIGIISSSAQIDTLFNIDGLVSESSQISFTEISNKPTLVSGSSQISYIGLSNIPSGIVSGSSQVIYTSLSSIPSGIVSGSSQILTLVSIDEDNMTSNSDTKFPTQQSVKNYVDTKVADLVSGSSETLDALNELAAALGNDPEFATTISNQIGGKVSQSLEIISGNGLTGGGDLTTNRTLAVGAGDGISVSADAVAVDGTVLRVNGFGVVSGSSQITYSGISSIPSGIVSGSTQVKSLLPSGTVSGSSQVNADSITNFDTNVKDKLNTDLVVSGSDSQVKTFLSLENVTNESKATMFSSPTFTGTVTAPTPSSNDNSTKVATTAYVQQELSDLIGNASVAFDTLGEISSSLAADSGALDSLVTTVSGKLSKSSNLSDLTDASVARTNLGVDVAGTDNSTDVTLAGSYDYLTISGQVITRNQIDASTDISNLNTTNVSEGSNLYYTDTRVKAKLNTDSVISGSSQVSFNGITDKPSLISGSSQVSYNGVSNIPSGIVSGSSQILTLVSIDEDNMTSNSDTKFPTQQSVKNYVDTKVADLVSGSPQTLDTLNELALALGNDPEFATTISNQIGGKVSQTLEIISGNGLTGGGDLTTNRIIQVGSGDGINVLADAVAVDGTVLRVNGFGVVSGSSQINANDVINFGTNVKNKLNTEGIISGSSQITYSEIYGIPSVIISSSAQVNADSITNFDSNVLTYNNSLGVISGSSQVNADSITNFDSNVLTYNNSLGVISGSASQVKTFLSLENVTNESKATMFSSPTFTGTVTAPTPSSNDNSTKVATTAYVQQELTDLIGGANSAFDTLIEISASLASGDSTLNTLVDGKLSKSSNLSDLTDASAARTNLGLAIGTNVQAYNSTLATVAGGTYSGDDSITTIGTVTAGSVTAILPNGVVSGSSQISYTNISNKPTIPSSIIDLNITDGTNGQVLTTNGSGVFSFQSIEADIDNFTLSNGVIDTSGSTDITITPAVTMSNDLTVNNDVTILGNLIVESSGTGPATFEAATNLELTAGNAVVVTSSPLRLASFTTTERNALAAQNGDLIYNTTLNKLQGYQNGTWINIDGS